MVFFIYFLRAAGCSRTCHSSAGRHTVQDPSPICRPSHRAGPVICIRRLAIPGPVICLEAITVTGTRHPDPPGPVAGPVVCPMTATATRILQQTVPITVPGPVTPLEAVLVPGTRYPAVPGAVPGLVSNLVTSLTSWYLQTPSLDPSPGHGILWNFQKVSGMYRPPALKRGLQRGLMKTPLRHVILCSRGWRLPLLILPLWVPLLFLQYRRRRHGLLRRLLWPGRLTMSIRLMAPSQRHSRSPAYECHRSSPRDHSSSV